MTIATTSPLPLPPGTMGLPLIGETIGFIRDPQFARKRQAQHGSLFKTHILGRPTACFCGPEANEFLLSSHADSFSWRGGWPGTFKELLGESLFLQEGAEHQRNRRLLMPAFHGRALEGYFSVMRAIAQTYLLKWEQQTQLTWFLELKKFTFEVASVLLLGTAPGEQLDELSSWFTDLTNGLFALPVRWGPTPYGRALRGRDRLLHYIENAIEERRAVLADPNASQPPTDVLTLLLQTEDEDGNRLSQEEIKVQSLLMLFAGHETTTSLLTSMAMVLAQNPQVLAQARAEQFNLVQQQGGDPTQALTLDQMPQMPYLDRVLKEAERMFPPVGGGFREVIKPVEFNGYRVPVGWLALYRIEAAHLDERCYSQPGSFDPDRFSPERAEQKRYDYSLVAFGGGPRVCLGMAFAKLEMKIMMALLLRDYQWAIAPNQNLTLDPVPTLSPVDGLKVTFSRL
ncbi:MAG: cytochrome P450 [Leptolyngbya foveolarum]|uniref:Cytochrome P450 n=1 Tax=Leptolyngbya foveolarum TaxID=47253 RepID=A0A2W4UFB0_9CYAN|nr:MAG: cytochrome P450 [Leptolyngbya foveolarum]